MPVLNQLGSFQFYRLSSTVSPNGTPEKLHMEKEFLQVPGFNGTSIRLMGIKGKPFELISEVDCPTRAYAMNLYGLYTQLEAQPPQSLVFRNYNCTMNYGCLYDVIEVMNPDVQVMQNKVGGLRGGQSVCYYLRAMWRLVPIALS